MQERDYFLGFSAFSGIGPGRFRLLIETFGFAEAAWTSARPRLAEVLKEKLTSDFLKFRDTFDISSYKKRLEKAGVSTIILDDAHYPKRLLDLKDPPFLIYYKGDKNLLTSKKAKIGIVGTRKITSYGETITTSFTEGLAESGLVTVSGLALGVDGLAHRVTVEAGGKTIAVLGCGVDCCYPSSNKRIYEEILGSGGLIMSEYPLSASPSKGSFPARNRIIAALSDGLLVTEGAEDSGSLITAQYALDLGRKVFAIPGPVTSGLSRGPLKLIRKGAILVTGSEEILEELRIKNYGLRKIKKTVKGDSRDEQKIIDLLQNEPMHIDEIVKKTGFDVSKTGTLLSMMEIKGIISLTDNKYSLLL